MKHRKVAASMVAAVLPLLLLSPTPASADTIATGVLATYSGQNTYPGPEVLAFIASGCAENHTDAITQAVVNVSEFKGEIVLLADAGADVPGQGAREVLYSFLGACQPQAMVVGSPPARPGNPVEIEVTADYLVFSQGAAPGTTNQRFRLETL